MPTLQFEFRPILTCGVLVARAGHCRIIINDALINDRRELAVTVWHELLHFLDLSTGTPKNEMSEEKTEAMAQRLADACPDIIEFCKVRGGDNHAKEEESR